MICLMYILMVVHPRMHQYPVLLINVNHVDEPQTNAISSDRRIGELLFEIMRRRVHFHNLTRQSLRVIPYRYS